MSTRSDEQRSNSSATRLLRRQPTTTAATLAALALLTLLVGGTTRRVAAQKLRWCDYLHALGVIAEECAPDDASMEKARQQEKRLSTRSGGVIVRFDALELQYPEYHLCQGRYGMCVKSEECESGM